MWLAAACLLLGACDDGRPPQDGSAAATPDAAQTPRTHHHHRAYSDQFPRPRRAGDFVITQLAVERPATDAAGHVLRPGRPGLDLWAEKVRTCVRRTSPEGGSVGWGDWRAEATDGHTYRADASGVRSLPTPTYPRHRVLAPGQCVTGWWLVPVPEPPGGPTAIEFAPGGGPTLITWPTLR